MENASRRTSESLMRDNVSKPLAKPTLSIQMPTGSSSSEGAQSPIFKQLSNGHPDLKLSSSSTATPFREHLSERHNQDAVNWSPTQDVQIDLFVNNGRDGNVVCARISESDLEVKANSWMEEMRRAGVNEAQATPTAKSGTISGTQYPLKGEEYRKYGETVGLSAKPPPAIRPLVDDMTACLAEAMQPEAQPQPNADPFRVTPRSRLSDYAMQYTSRRDLHDGPHRTTTDGDLLSAETGDFIVLDDPSACSSNKRNAILPKPKTKKIGPAIPLPEAKNGATGWDKPREPKPLSRVVWNYVTRSNQPPVEKHEEEGKLFDVDTRCENIGKASGGMGMRVEEGDVVKTHMDMTKNKNNNKGETAAIGVDNDPVTTEELRVLLESAAQKNWRVDSQTKRKLQEAILMRWEEGGERAFGQGRFKVACTTSEPRLFRLVGRWARDMLEEEAQTL
jgi:hypothetical protein